MRHWLACPFLLIAMVCNGQTRDQCAIQMANPDFREQACMHHSSHSFSFGGPSVGLVLNGSHHLYRDKIYDQPIEALVQKEELIDLSPVSIQWSEAEAWLGYGRYEMESIRPLDIILTFDIYKPDGLSSTPVSTDAAALTMQLQQAAKIRTNGCYRSEDRQNHRLLMQRVKRRTITQLLLAQQRAKTQRLYVQEIPCIYRDGNMRRLVMACPYQLTKEQRKTCRKKQTRSGFYYVQTDPQIPAASLQP